MNRRMPIIFAALDLALCTCHRPASQNSATLESNSRAPYAVICANDGLCTVAAKDGKPLKLALWSSEKNAERILSTIIEREKLWPNSEPTFVWGDCPP